MSGITLETVAATFRQLSENENETMFAQGLLMLKAVEAGFKPSDVKRECGLTSGKAARTIDMRLRVASVFGDDGYAKDFDWSIHALCASAPGVVASKTETYSIARQWLEIAEAGITENGEWRPHTTRTLKRLIKPTTEAKPEPPQSYTFTASVESLTALMHEMKLHILEDYDVVSKLPITGVFTVTITPQATAELEAA